MKKTATKAATRVVKKSNVISAGKSSVSSVDITDIKSKRLSEAIQSAFDSIKSDSRLVVKVDDVLKEVKYAQGNMSTRLVRQNAGAMVQGKTMWIERSTQKYVDKDFITHEIGHKVTKYGDKMTDATAKRVAEELAKELGYKSVKSMSLVVSEYASKNPTELFPEAFMEYYSGKELKGEKKKVVEVIN